MGEQHLSVYDRVTNEIIAALEKGFRPWEKPWQGDSTSRPVRPLRHTGDPYNGVNVLLLWSRSYDRGYQNPTWMTYKQASEYGAQVRAGEKSAYIVYANTVKKTEADASGAEVEKEIPFLRGYSVFNVEQIEGLPDKFLLKSEPPIVSNNIERIERLDQFFQKTGTDIRHGGGEAYYNETADYIQMPPIGAFNNAEGYYSTLAHEATHWTAHKSRLERRFEQTAFGTPGYAKEELVAEIGAAFLCADLAITPEVRESHAAYIANWLTALKNDHKYIFSAASHASRAVEFLKGKQGEMTPDLKPESLQAAAPKQTLSNLTI